MRVHVRLRVRGFSGELVLLLFFFKDGLNYKDVVWLCYRFTGDGYLQGCKVLVIENTRTK